ncbi:937_t:CDS:2 [Gigaspora rosea]|nr:937_t:CDS:2 [Gigaspora rosea]
MYAKEIEVLDLLKAKSKITVNNNPDKVSVADLLKPKHKIVAYNNQAEVSVADLLKHKRVANKTSLADLLKHKRVANETSLANLLKTSLLKSKHKKMDNNFSVADLLKKPNKWCVYICSCNQCNGIEVDPRTQKAHAEDKRLWSSSKAQKKQQQIVAARYSKTFETHFITKKQSYDISVPYDDSTGIPYDDSVSYDDSVPYDGNISYDNSVPYDNGGPYDNIDIAPYNNTIYTMLNKNTEQNMSSDSIKDLLIFRPRTTYFQTPKSSKNIQVPNICSNENADNSNIKPSSEDESISDNFSEDENWELEQD